MSVEEDKQQVVNQRKDHKERQWGITVAVVLVALLISWALESRWAQDIWQGLWYQPSVGMQEIRDSLELTGKGERIFAATQPVLEGKDDFNAHCESYDREVSLLGCYTEGKVYVYEVETESLRPSNKVTTAHELLHAVWERLSESERKEIEGWLKQVEVENREWFEEELEAYAEGDKLEEMYTRAGTKLRDLPEELEKHYAKYFANRAKIVDFYEEYQAPFQELQDELERLEKEIVSERTEIIRQRDEYENRGTSLSAQVRVFNSRASVPGGFRSEAEFQRERNALLKGEEDLEKLRNEVNTRIDENNARIEEYEKIRESLGELSDAMNSNVEKIEKTQEGEI